MIKKCPSSVANVLAPRNAHRRHLARFSALLIALSYAPLLLLHFKRLWGNEHYHHFPFVLAAICVLGWQRLRIVAEVPRETFAKTRAGARVMALLLLAAAVLFWSPWIAAVSAIIMIGTVVLGGGSRKPLAPVWLLLWLLIPLPFGWDSQLTSWLQGVSSRAGSRLLDLLGHDHLLAGHVIEVPGRQFLVEEACSGIRSVFVLATCAALFAVVGRRRWFHALTLIVAAMSLAVVTNVGRVTSVVILSSAFGVDVTHGWRHEALGVAVFAAAILLLLSVDQLIEFFLAPVPVFSDEDAIDLAEEEVEQEEPVPGLAVPSPSRSGFGLLMLGAITVLCGLLLVVQLRLVWTAPELVRDTASDQPLAGTGESSLPAEYAEWNRVSYELVTRESNSNYGNYSNIWKYQRETTTASVCLDYPFTGWHTLEQCYRGQGWSVASWRVITADEATDPLQQPFVQIELERPAGETALLLFCLFDRRAQPLVAPQAEVSLAGSLSGILRRVDLTVAKLGLSDLLGPVVTTPTYQFQALVSTPHALTNDERQRAIDLFTHTRRITIAGWQNDG